ncbi:MAG: type II secretion system F family protein [bacterium]
MSQYYYKATKDGKILKGEIEAKDKKEVASILQNQEYRVISINQKTFFNSTNFLQINLGGIPLREKTLFLRQIAYMIQAGLPINQALETMAEQTKNIQFKKVIKRITVEVQEGVSLSQSLQKHSNVFDKVIINLVKAGEESGKLDEILDRLAFDYEKKQEFQGKVKGAMIYPVIILLVVVLVVVLLMIFMIPSIKNLYKDFGGKNKELPAITNFMVSASDFLIAYWWGVSIVAVIAFIGFKYYAKTPGGRIVLDTLKLKIPVFGKLIILSQIADFSRGLAMLLKSGVPIVRSMTLVSESMNNQLFSDEIADAAKRLEKGVVMSQAISKESPFTPMVFQMLSIGEQTGKTDVTLAKLADYYEREVDQMTSNLTKILEPIILIVMGGIVLFIALAVYLPIYTLQA